MLTVVVMFRMYSLRDIVEQVIERNDPQWQLERQVEIVMDLTAENRDLTLAIMHLEEANGTLVQENDFINQNIAQLKIQIKELEDLMFGEYNNEK